jgi:hypothetical protein
MSAILSHVRVRRYPNCSAFFVLAFDPAPGRLPKERVKVLAAFGRKDKAERFAQERRASLEKEAR